MSSTLESTAQLRQQLFAQGLLGTTGRVFYVNSTAAAGTSGTSAGFGRTPNTPFSTLAACLAIGSTAGGPTASNGDVIVLMPGHAETISAAGTITVATAGLTIVGLGNGDNRPTFTWSATASSWLIIAANVTIRNIVTKVSIDEVVSMFAVSAAGVTFDRVDFVETTSAQAIQWLLTTAAADRLTVQNCRHTQVTAAGSAQKWIQLVAGTGARIVDNTFLLTAFASTSSHCISGSTAVIQIEIARNNILFLGATITIVVNLVTTSTGIIADNRAGSGTSVATAAAFTGDACFMFNNLWADTAAASGLLAPVVDTDT